MLHQIAGLGCHDEAIIGVAHPIAGGSGQRDRGLGLHAIEERRISALLRVVVTLINNRQVELGKLPPRERLNGSRVVSAFRYRLALPMAIEWGMPSWSRRALACSIRIVRWATKRTRRPIEVAERIISAAIVVFPLPHGDTSTSRRRPARIS